MMKTTAILAGLLFPISTIAVELPERKPGLWELQTTMQSQTAGTKMKQCVDAASDAKMMEMGKTMDRKKGGNCTKKEFKKSGNSYVSESDCTNGDTRTITTTTFSGNFTSEYRGETTIKHEPARAGTKEEKMVMNARWVGPCEADQKPGDMILPGGMKMNIESLEQFRTGINR